MTTAPAQTHATKVEWRRHSLTVEDIDRLLPHRYPFALLDRVTEVVPGVSATGIKNISVADPILVGHFPGRRIYPGVLIVECVAQLAAVVYGTEAALAAGDQAVADVSHKVGYLAEIKQAKFHRVVTPGDQLTVKVLAGQRMGQLISVTGQVSVQTEPVMTARLVVTQMDG